MASLADKTRNELPKTDSGQLAPAGAAIVSQIEQLEAKVVWFEEQYRLAKLRKFGPSSEQTAVALEPNLFNEAEVCAVPDLPEPTVELVTRRRKKTKGKREAQLANLREENIEYCLPVEEQVCPQCEGELHDMGVEVRQEIKIIPAEVVAVNHNRHKYTCRHCQQEETTTPVIIAPMPKPAFPKAMASPSAVAHIMTEKFVMGSPLYRQAQQFEREGIDISRQTMANWMITGADWLVPVYAMMHIILVGRRFIHADETSLQVLNEPGRAATTDSYMWLYRSGREGPAIVLFEYQATRAREHPKNFLDGFRGYLNSDGYDGYDGISKAIILVGCWAHARRKFVEAVKILPAAARKEGKSDSHVGLSFCDQLFAIERELLEASADERYHARLERSVPVLARLKAWLDSQATRVIPKSALGTAIGYCNNQWTKLNAFLLDGRLEIDNNRAERSIKPFVIGRKNWLFANTPRGATSSAIIYSIVETAKENGLSPFRYLEYLFETMPNIDANDQAAAARVLPWSDQAQARCASKKQK